MLIMRFLFSWIDPDGLIRARSWWVIAGLAVLTGILFAATVMLMTMGERSIHLTTTTLEKSKRTDILGKELSILEKNIKQFGLNIRTYMTSGNPADLEASQKNREYLADNRPKLYQLVQASGWPDLAIMNNLIDSIFITGDLAIELQHQGRTEAALNEMVQLKTLNRYNYVLNLSNRLFRNQVDTLNHQIEGDANIVRGSFWAIPVFLASLAGLLFLLLIYGMATTVRRVMDDRRAYRLIYEEQQKASAFTQNLINILPIGYHSINDENIIIDMNQTALDWLGYTREEVVGKMKIYELYSDESVREQFFELFDKFKAAGGIKNMELNFLAKDGSVIPTLFNSKACYHGNGEFSHSISTTYNFTERKKLEDELVHARQEAVNAQHLKQLFMANMSHEIRTPLNAILGFSNLLESSNLPTSQQEYVQSIQISGINLLSIVNDILDFEKIQSGMLRMEELEFDLPGLLHSVVTMMRSSADAKRLKLQLDVDPELPMLVIGDPMRLTQVMINLLSNAIKFTESGSVKLCVRALPSARPDGMTRIQFNIKDTGIGIPVSEQTRIFERFIQASNDTMRKYGGTGLGLAIVKRIVELQNGSIYVVSEVGRGSTFTVELPFPLAQSNSIARMDLPSESFVFPDFSGHRILLVEDNPMNRRIAELNLIKCGLTVTQATDGLQAIEILRVDPTAFDLVFMDIQMPVMDGYSTAKFIRKELGLTELPIIAVTAHVLSGEREKVLKSGMNDYLTKPIHLKEIATVLHRYLSGFWDEQLVSEYTHGKDENLREIIALFNRQFPEELSALKSALDCGDFQKIAVVAHSMRSTVGYTGFSASMGELLMEMEALAVSGMPDMTRLHALYNNLTNYGRIALDLLQREVTKRPKRVQKNLA